MPKQLSQKEALLIELGLINRALSVLLAKRKAYSGSKDPVANLRVSKIFDVDPVKGTLIRLTDKLQRISRYSEQGAVGESIWENDLPDVINYISIAAVLLLEKSPDEHLRGLVKDGEDLIDTLNQLYQHIDAPDDHS